ncbi:MAG: hypothetical protein OWU33_14655 [Firmicutes bacterium]|nr:hypothetical protein [Bacillota bacterium]
MADQNLRQDWEWSELEWGLADEALAEHYESVRHLETLGLKPLSSGLTVLIWGLRLYVLFMAVVVIVNVVQTVH